MRLIRTRTLELEEFSSEHIPPYAILSHTWGADEVTYEDMVSGTYLQRRGWTKIVQTCSLARKDDVDFAWVDTCCIDKSSSAELSESINSMSRWYKDAVVCYAYLEDFEDSQDAPFIPQFSNCLWWSRGWTLQELIASHRLQFHSKSWSLIGTKAHLAKEICAFSSIPSEVLCDSKPLYKISVAARMSWAAERKTTRIEDEAYCLLGLFQVYMPLIYGEGRRAFHRLQEEIIKQSNDLSILACPTSNQLLAISPNHFTGMNGCIARRAKHFDFSVTNTGLKCSGSVRLIMIPSKEQHSGRIELAMHLGSTVDNGRQVEVVLLLRKVRPRVFACRSRVKLQIPQIIDKWLLSSGFYILLDADAQNMAQDIQKSRKNAIHIPSSLRRGPVVPELLWDPEDELVLGSGSKRNVSRVIAFRAAVTLESEEVSFIILCRRFHRDQAKVYLVCGSQVETLRNALFENDVREESYSWGQFILFSVLAGELSSNAQLEVGKQRWELSVTLKTDAVNPDRHSVQVSSRKLCTMVPSMVSRHAPLEAVR